MGFQGKIGSATAIVEVSQVGATATPPGMYYAWNKGLTPGQPVVYALGNAQSPDEVGMVQKQSEAEKAQAMKEYREALDAAIQRIATLRAARLARDATTPPTQTKGKKPVPK
jgi:hypothetical protein